MGMSVITSDVMKDAPQGEALSLQELSTFLSRYSARLLGAGSTCIRLVSNVTRIAKAYGAEVDLYVMPRHVHISLWRAHSSERVTSIATVNHNVINFNLNTQLSQLSWEISDGKIPLDTAVTRFDEILDSQSQNRWLVVGVVALANASFCRLFGGDITAMATVGIATLIGYLVKLLLLRWHFDLRVVVLVCGFVSSLIGGVDVLLGAGHTPIIALGTSILYLVPGIPFLNAFSDLLYRHYICAFSRGTDALVLTACMSAGLFAGMSLLNISMF